MQNSVARAVVRFVDHLGLETPARAVVPRRRWLCEVSGAALSGAAALALAGALPDSALAQVTVNPVQSTTYNLSPGANPITFGSGTNITTTTDSFAVFGSNSNTAWSVTNQGVLNGATNTGIWISGTSLTLTNSGQISGQIEGVLTTTGTPAVITNQTGGTISSPEVAITVNAGGSITNQAGGTISGALGAIQFAPTDSIYSNTITNAGVISSTASFATAAIMLTPNGPLSPASVVNQSGGVIRSGSIGIFAQANGPTYSNNLFTVTNAAGASIDASGTAILVITNPASITNAGTIRSTNSEALNLAAGGTVTNQTGGSITGAPFGVKVSGGAGSVTNAGTITGGTWSVVFQGAGANTLTLQTGSTLIGGADGSTATGATNALILQGAGEADNAFVNFQALTVQGPGTWTLGGTSSIGAAEVAAGKLVVTGALSSAFTVDPGATLQGSTSTLLVQGAVSNNGTLVFDQAADGTFTNAISGTGALIKQNTGTLTLGGTSSAATTEVAGGELVVTGALTSAFKVDSGATLQLGSGGTTGAIVGNVADNGTLVFNRSDVVTFAGTVSGSGQLTQAGTGTIILNGDNTVTGQTTVAAGVLEVGDAAHPGAVLDGRTGGLVVGANGTLAGHGTVVGAVNNTAGGTVSPGGTIGTLTVGAYTQGANSTLAIEVSPTAASQLNSLGSASLNGKLSLTFDPGTYGAHIYKLLAGAPVTGSFTSVVAAGSPGAGLTYGLDYTPTQVDLVIEPTFGAQVYGGVSLATLDRAQNLAGLVEDRFGEAGCADGTTDKRAASCHGMGAWAQAIVTTDRLNSSGANAGFTNTSSGFLGGVDRRWENGSSAGAAFGYEEDNLSMGGAQAKASGAGYFGALYGRWVAGRAWFDGQAFYMHSDWTVSREVTGGGIAKSSPGGNTEGFLFQASAPVGNGDLRPYARVVYARFGRDSAIETGVGPLGFAVNSTSTASGVAEAGLLYAHSYVGEGGREARPALQLGVQDAFGDRSGAVAGSLSGLGGSGFTVGSVRIPQAAGVIDASLKVKLNQSFQFSADLRGRFSGAQSEASASVGGVLQF